jgi:hypothetical protein
VERAEVCTSVAWKIGEAACGRVGAGTLAISLVGKVRLVQLVVFRNRGVYNWNKFVTTGKTLRQADFTLPIEML